MCERTQAGVRRDPAAAEDGVVEDTDRVGEAAHDERGLLGADAETEARDSIEALDRRLATDDRLDRLAQGLRRRTPGRDQEGVSGLESELLSPLLVDDGVDRRLDLRRVGPDVHLRCVGGAAEPQVVVLVDGEALLQLGRDGQLPARDPIPDHLLVGTRQRCEEAVRRGVDRGDGEGLVLDHRLPHGEERRRLDAVQVLDLLDHVLVERAFGAEDEHVRRRERVLPPAGRLDGVLRVGDLHPRRALAGAAVGRGRRRGGGVRIVTPAAARGHPGQCGPGCEQAQPTKPSHPVRVGGFANLRRGSRDVTLAT